MKRWEYTSLTILVLLLVLLNRFSVAQSMKSMFISDDLTSKCPQTPEDLQYAIDTASSGDTIELLPITYEGDFVLRSRNPGDKITIRGKRDSISNSHIIINGRNGQTIINGIVGSSIIGRNGQTIINTDANYESNTYTYVNGKLISHSHSSGKGTQQSTIQANGTAFTIVQGIWTIESLSIVSGDVGIEIVNGNQNTVRSVSIMEVNTGVIINKGDGNRIQSTSISARQNGVIIIEGSNNAAQSCSVSSGRNGFTIQGSDNAIQSVSITGRVLYCVIKEVG
jgi:hypothetical protein